VRAAAHEEAQPAARPGRPGVLDPDPRGGEHARVGQRALALDPERVVPEQVDPVEPAVDRQRLGQPPRARAELLRPARARPALEHRLDALGGLDRADQHRRAEAGLAADHVQHEVHAVGEIHVGVSAPEPHRLVARRAPPAEGVAGAVDRAEVRLDLDDPAGEPAAGDDAHERLAEQPPCGGDGVGSEARETLRHAVTPSSERASVWSWISLVPPPISNILASRASFSSPVSAM
jgi:hypothetical protein